MLTSIFMKYTMPSCTCLCLCKTTGKFILVVDVNLHYAQGRARVLPTYDYMTDNLGCLNVRMLTEKTSIIEKQITLIFNKIHLHAD